MHEKVGEDNIILIGMPGVGKSTIGVVLAKVLGYHFLDSDLLIQERTKRLLKDIIEEEGIDAFVEIENEVNKSIMAEKTVIATGGSVVYGKAAMEHLSKMGKIIYLKLSYNSIENRLGNLEQRGVVLKPEQDLKALYEERCPLYEKYANKTVNCEEKEIEEVVKLIIASLSEK